MGRKIFISYKYADTKVRPIQKTPPMGLIGNIFNPTTARNYVDFLQDYLNQDDHINKGEQDGEDLSKFKEETISSKLRDKIHNSSITIVFISKGMKDEWINEEDQWIPWEISYSLKEVTRNDRVSRTNAVLAIVLPDDSNSYSYFITENNCPYCNCQTLNTNFLFKILKDNMFNKINSEFSDCKNHSANTVHLGEHSYIKSVKWDDFIKDINYYIEKALTIRNNIQNYNITKITKKPTFGEWLGLK